MEDKNDRTYDTEGYKGRQEDIRKLVIKPELDTIENKYSDRDYIVTLETSEFVSICPKTGLPDFADITIEYIPSEYLVEEKSLKLYFTAYRDIGIFQEHATNKIMDDFVKVVKPKWFKINAVWNQRGGIGVVVNCEWKRK